MGVDGPGMPPTGGLDVGLDGPGLPAEGGELVGEDGWLGGELLDWHPASTSRDTDSRAPRSRRRLVIPISIGPPERFDCRSLEYGPGAEFAVPAARP
jgi:hypothetical protein